MAEIKLSMDEYRAMEDSVAQKSKRIKELEKEVDGLKEYSRVVIESESFPFSETEIIRSILNHYQYTRSISDSIRAVFRGLTPIKSKQYVNFNDVKQEVTNKFQREIEDSILRNNERVNVLEDRIVNLDAEHKKEITSLNSEFEKELKKKDEIITELKEKLEDANKSVEEKKQELEIEKANIEKKIKELEDKYKIKSDCEVRSKKKSWWKSLIF